MKELVVLAGLISLCSTGKTPCDKSRFPGWPKSYSVRGVMHLPHAEIKEPFMAYYNETIGSSRIDYYDGTVKTYQFSKMGRYGTMIKIVPVTTETQLNVMTCLRANGTADGKIVPQHILPSLDEFKCVGTKIINGVEAQKWVKIDKDQEMTYRYTMYLRFEKTKKGSEPVPILYIMKGINTLLGSHFDHYYLSYHTYKPHVPSPSVWKLEPNMTCKYFSELDAKTMAYLNPIAEFVHNYDHHIKESWNEHKIKHNRVFDGVEDHHMRSKIFRDNHRFVQSMNRAGLGYHLKLNRFADWSENEMKIMRGRKYTPASKNASDFPHSQRELSEKIPSDFDWRLYGAVNPVKDQSVCGSCWSFGTTGTVEGAYFLKTGQLVMLSEQALIDCSWGFDNNGCDGGEVFGSYEWIKKHGGLPLDTDYGGYLGEDAYCHLEGIELVAPITGYVNVTAKNEKALRLAIFKNGPVAIGINASKKTFSFYSHGVYSDPECTGELEDLDHDVLVVGYGKIEGKKYWLVKNSWSDLWGNDGYILIASDNNICGVMTQPSYVTM